MKRALLAAATLALLSAPVLADQALATAKNCMACHAVDKKLVGPSYKDVAKKYAGDATAVDKLAEKVMKGKRFDLNDMKDQLEQMINMGAVSYTHLTLPTKRIV